MKRPVEKREEVLLAFLGSEISKKQAAELLGCTTRTIEHYRTAYRLRGRDGLCDHRHSNYHKLTEKEKTLIVAVKQRDRWRSARNIRDHLRLAVHAEQVRRILANAGLMKQNVERVKPIQRFEAQLPNELWQCDIMGKIDFPKIGTLYLIATLDDHSRFCLGNGFERKGR